MILLLLYLISINLISFILFGIDKRYAKQHRWRISERKLFLFLIMGGTVGGWAGMKLFRHKTLHLKFRIGIPILFAMQLLVAVFLFRQPFFNL